MEMKNETVLLILVPALICIFSSSTLVGIGVSANESSSNRLKAITQQADSVAVHAKGRGLPFINLGDGYDLPTTYTGPPELTQILEQDQAQPLALASADFD